MLVFKGAKISIAVQVLNAAFVISFMLWSFHVSTLEAVAGSLLQLLLIILLIFWRRRRLASLFFIPDEFIVFLPMLWALANAGSATSWFAVWKWPYVLAFLLSLFWSVFHSENFITGLKNNRLWHAVTAFVMFIAVFLPFLGTFFPLFATTLAFTTLLNMAVLVMSFSISAAGISFSSIKPDTAPDYK